MRYNFKLLSGPENISKKKFKPQNNNKPVGCQVCRPLEEFCIIADSATAITMTTSILTLF